MYREVVGCYGCNNRCLADECREPADHVSRFRRQNENARADDGADTEHCELDGAERTVQGLLLGRRQNLIERLNSELLHVTPGWTGRLYARTARPRQLGASGGSSDFDLTTQFDDALGGQ